MTGIVAALRLPLAIDELAQHTRRLEREHGHGLVMRQAHGRLLVLRPGWKPANCWCINCEARYIAELAKFDIFASATFVVCPDCGNKRCPRATSHQDACSGSNESGQEGSMYVVAPLEPRPMPDEARARFRELLAERRARHA